MSFSNGSLLKSSGGQFYIIVNNTKRLIPDAVTLQTLTLNAPQTLVTAQTDAVLNAIANGTAFTSLSAYVTQPAFAQANAFIRNAALKMISAAGGISKLPGGMAAVALFIAQNWADAIANPAKWSVSKGSSNAVAQAAIKILTDVINKALNDVLKGIFNGDPSTVEDQVDDDVNNTGGEYQTGEPVHTDDGGDCDVTDAGCTDDDGCTGGTCDDTCDATCDDTCAATCEATCDATCEDTCANTCEATCEATCAATCEATCEATCQATCEASCDVSCGGSCDVSCGGTCNESCGGSCDTCDCDISDDCGFDDLVKLNPAKQPANKTVKPNASINQKRRVRQVIIDMNSGKISIIF